MALQMGPDNLPGYLPPGRVPFCKCREEALQVLSCRLCDCGTGAEAMLLCFPPCFTLCPRLGHKKLQGSAGHLVFNLYNSEKSGTCLILALVLPNKMRANKRHGSTWHTLQGKISCRASPQIFCVLYEGKTWPSAAERYPAYWEQKRKVNGCVQTLDEWLQSKLCNLIKVEIRQPKPAENAASPSSLQKQGTRPSFATGH